MKLFLKCIKSPGDILMLSAAVRDLHIAHPNKFETAVSTNSMDIWKNNPYISKFSEAEADRIIECHYPLIKGSNECGMHFIHGYRLFLEKELGVEIPLTKFKGDIHLSDLEKKWKSQIQEKGIQDKFWIMCAGGKWDFTSKWWVPSYWQDVVDHFKGKITFVQTGREDHFHPKLDGVVNLIGQTNLRQYIRLFYHSIGVVSPITCAMHFAAAVPSKYGLNKRPCVVVASAIEPPTWEQYSWHKYISRAGTMKCCEKGGCWKIKSSKIKDVEFPSQKVCINRIPYPIPEGYDNIEEMYIPHCMNEIKPEEVIKGIEQYYTGGILKYN